MEISDVSFQFGVTLENFPDFVLCVIVSNVAHVSLVPSGLPVQ